MITLTNKAIAKLKEIAKNEELTRLTVRVKLLGGGCAGFQHDMYFEDHDAGPLDETYEIDGIELIVDQVSLQYLDGTEIDFIDSVISSGFKFINPNVSSACGCGNSVSF